MESYSVLMSVYRKENPTFFRASLDSIFSQTIATNDFVLVCDGPLTEDLDSVVQEYVLKYPSVFHVIRLKENVGLAEALNEGLPCCKNELIARMDSDDVAAPNRCELQLQTFDQYSDVSIVGGFISEFERDPSNVISVKTMPCEFAELLRYAKKRSPFNHPTVMYRKSAVLSVGGYPNLPLHEDYALWVNLLMAEFKGRNISEILCYMRVDGGLYSRRGGLRYCKTAVSFRLYMLKSGFCNFWEFLISAGAVSVMCLVPTGLRRKFYGTVLRKKVTKG